MGPWVQQKPLEKANLGFEQGTIGVMEARPWTPLSTMPPPGEAWSIAMHKQSFTHQWFIQMLQKMSLDNPQLTSIHPAGLECVYGKCGLDTNYCFCNNATKCNHTPHHTTPPHNHTPYHTTHPAKPLHNNSKLSPEYFHACAKDKMR